MVMPVQAPQSMKSSIAAVLAIAAGVVLVMSLISGRSGASDGAAESGSSTSTSTPPGTLTAAAGADQIGLVPSGAPGDSLASVRGQGSANEGSGTAAEPSVGGKPTGSLETTQTSTQSSVATTTQAPVTATTQPQQTTTTTPVVDPDGADQPDRAADPLEPPPPVVVADRVEFAAAADAEVDLTNQLGSQYVLLDVGLGPNSTFFMMDEDENLVGADLNTSAAGLVGTVVVTNAQAARILIVGSSNPWTAIFRGIEADDLLSPNGTRQGSGSDVVAFAIAPSVARLATQGCAASERIEMHSYGAGSLITTTVFSAGELPSSVSVSPATELISLRTECDWTISFES